jgi:hypothetical protein
MNLNNNHLISFFKINNNFYKTADHRFEFIPTLFNHMIIYLEIVFTQKKLIFLYTILEINFYLNKNIIKCCLISYFYLKIISSKCSKLLFQIIF